MELKETVELMNSEDYKERFIAEYRQVKIRYEKLKNFCNKIEVEEMFEKLGYTKCNNCTNPSYFKKDDPYVWINFNNKRVAISSQLDFVKS